MSLVQENPQTTFDVLLRTQTHTVRKHTTKAETTVNYSALCGHSSPKNRNTLEILF